MGLLNTISFITRHPLNRGDRLRAVARFAWWQLRSRVKGPAIVPFVNDSRLEVSHGQAGATGNIYAGLHEVEEMGFTLHFLRPSDLFVDVGANIGAYTILASAAVGARSVAFEPATASFRALCRNVEVNQVEALVDARQSAVGATVGIVSMTSGADTLNHVVAAGSRESFVTAPVTTLDGLFERNVPTLIKIDVEGFESEVVKGAYRTLRDPGLLAVILETNGSGTRYDASDESVHRQMVEAGFGPFSYDPLERRLTALAGAKGNGNTIYLRDPGSTQARLAGAPRFDIAGRRSI